MQGHRHFANRMATFIAKRLGGEAAAGLLLIAAAAAAVAVANSPLSHGYHALLHDRMAWSPIARLDSWHLWINDGLMALFFFVVGLEIKRELLDGELSSAARRRLPVLAAVAGMAMPALIYGLIAGGDPALIRGWAIPAATDIAFAVGVLALLGKRIPASLRLFLLSVAIIDDLGAVAIIALVYTADIDPLWLAAALSCLAAMIACNRLNVTRGRVYTLLALLLWYAVLHSGVHATIAGVAAACTIPLRLDKQGDSLLLRMEHALVPWNAYLVVPLFGFANAGVSLALDGPAAMLAPLPLAIAAGLVLGKQLGIFGAVLIAERTGFAPRPAGTSWQQVWGMALLCGIGFTMSLFIGSLAFPGSPALIEEARLGVLAGSLVSAVLGFAVLRAGSGSGPPGAR